MGWESFGVVRFDPMTEDRHPSSGHPRIAKLKSSYNSLIVCAPKQVCYPLGHSGCESVDMVRFDLGTLLQGQMRIAKIESAYNSLIIGDRDLGW